jgi:DNA replication protein DnaC
LRLTHEPVADCARYDRLRSQVMERTQVLELMSTLKLLECAAAYDEVMGNGIKRQHEPPRIVGDLLQSEIAEKQARSIRYQLSIAKLPLAKDIDDFDFADTLSMRACAGVGRRHVRRRPAQRVLVGGTGTGKSHLAIAIARELSSATARRAASSPSSIWSTAWKRRHARGKQGRTAD